VLGARLTELGKGEIAAATFKEGSGRLGAVLDWVDAQAGLSEKRASLLGAWVWWSLLALLGLVLVARIAPRLAVTGGVIWVIGAALVPPTGAAIQVDASRAIAVPLSDGEDVVVGTFDLTLGQGGAHLLPGAWPASLDDARPGGGCVLSTDTQTGWRVQGAPNARRRLTVFTIAQNLGPGTPADTPAPADGRMEQLAATAAIGLKQPPEQDAQLWRFIPTTAAAEPPRVLPVPADP
jgi:hypothetical protein